jgi:hypothetical protein
MAMIFDMDEPIRAEINSELAYMTTGTFVTPYNALAGVAMVLAKYNIFVPRMETLNGNEGHKTWPLQMTKPIGADENGNVNLKAVIPYHLFFEYVLDDGGWYQIFCEIVNNEELEEILTDIAKEQSNESR